MRNLRIMILFLLLTAVSCQLSAVLWAQKAGRKLNVISGEVSAVTKNFIAVVYSRNEADGSEKEIAMPLSKDAVVEHKRSLSEIKVGDLVDLEFEEYTEETLEGPVTTRVAIVVRFLRAAAKQVQPFTFESATEEEETEE